MCGTQSTSFGWEGGMIHSVSGRTRGVQVKLWDPLRTRAIPERLRGVFTTRHYTNPRLPLHTGVTDLRRWKWRWQSFHKLRRPVCWPPCRWPYDVFLSSLPAPPSSSTLHRHHGLRSAALQRQGWTSVAAMDCRAPNTSAPRRRGSASCSASDEPPARNLITTMTILILILIIITIIIWIIFIHQNGRNAYKKKRKIQ